MSCPRSFWYPGFSRLLHLARFVFFSGVVSLGGALVVSGTASAKVTLNLKASKPAQQTTEAKTARPAAKDHIRLRLPKPGSDLGVKASAASPADPAPLQDSAKGEIIRHKTDAFSVTSEGDIIVPRSEAGQRMAEQPAQRDTPTQQAASHNTAKGTPAQASPKTDFPADDPAQYEPIDPSVLASIAPPLPGSPAALNAQQDNRPQVRAQVKDRTQVKDRAQIQTQTQAEMPKGLVQQAALNATPVPWDGIRETENGRHIAIPSAPESQKLRGSQIADYLKFGSLNLDGTVPKRELVVSLSSQMLYAFEEGKLQMSMPVVVGKPYRKYRTPRITDKVVKVILNPDWYPTPSMVKRGVRPGRRAPSKNHPMGQVKVITEKLSQQAIVLHGVHPRLKKYFGHSNRKLSSGCVRLPKEVDVAKFILGGTSGWDEERIEKVVATNRMTSIVPDVPVSVRIVN